MFVRCIKPLIHRHARPARLGFFDEQRSSLMDFYGVLGPLEQRMEYMTTRSNELAAIVQNQQILMNAQQDAIISQQKRSRF